MDMNFLQPTKEADKYAEDGKWFKSFGKYVLSKYDSERFRGTSSAALIELGENSSGIREWDYLGGSPIAAAWQHYSYVTQRQDNEKFGFISKDNDNDPLPLGASWVRTNKIQELIGNFIGRTMDKLEYQEFDLRSITPSIITKKTIKFTLADIKRNNKEVFDDFKKKAIEFSPLGGVEDDIESDDEYEDYKENKYKEPVEVECQYILDDIKIRNDYANYFSSALFHSSVSGLTATKPYVKDGKVWWESFDRRDVIFDNSRDSILHEKDNFLGLIRRMTPSAVIEAYGEELSSNEEGKKVLEKLKKMTESSYADISSDINLNLDGGLDSIQNSNGLPEISVVDCYIKALKDTRYVVRKNEQYGNNYIVKLKKDNTKENDQFWWETWYQVTMIGDLGIVNYGECTNIVENFNDRKRVEPPVIIGTPEMIDGYAQSIVGKMTQSADIIDFFWNKIIDIARKSKGRVYFVNGEVMNNKTIDVIDSEFQKFGGTVITKMQGDDAEFESKQKLVDIVDLSATTELTVFDQLITRQESIMEEMISANEIVLGQQNKYIPSQTQNQTIQQTQYGVYKYVKGFISYINKVLQVSVNMQKNLVGQYNTEYGVPVTSKVGQKFLKLIDEIPLQDLQIYIRPIDPLTEAMRSAIMSQMERLASNPESGILPSDISKMFSLKTVAELQKHFDKVSKRIETERKERMEMQQQQQQQMLEAQQQQEIISKEMEQEGKLKEIQANTQAGIIKQEHEKELSLQE